MLVYTSYDSSVTRSFIHFFLFTITTPTVIYTLSLHDALPIYLRAHDPLAGRPLGVVAHDEPRRFQPRVAATRRSEEHTSELQSRFDLVCRLLLEKKKSFHRGDVYHLISAAGHPVAVAVMNALA